ncbi:potassium/proton antiporter [Emcibacter sp. SYSU 3D8]|uniref:potassium/proton antiporter n=1 Tax=Emcibacter sp. SYSU 3D8 TaxID=3133969 RepID=UPI0031FE589A
MEWIDHIIMLSSGLIVLSILVGLVSTRFGAPLLLVFLILGMLAGEDGPGGIYFDNFHVAYAVGSLALAIILFDGGLRTERKDFRDVLAPAATLASVGVVITAAIAGLAAKWFMGVGWIEGLLVGSIVASTDAAAVFFLLNVRGVRLRDRLRATLEVEAGLNDPMAVFLTITFLTILQASNASPMDTAQTLMTHAIVQLLGGVVFGVLGGSLLLTMVNRLNLSAGLYPVLAVAGGLLVFAAAQSFGASGFLAVYLAGYVFGRRRHKATQLIERFTDGMAWLSQIAMFLILGLLITPSKLLPMLAASIGIAAVLIFIARPVAGFVCLWPYKFSPREIGFVSWVGLRGAVPIYLGTIPILAGVPGSQEWFSVVYMVVITSLVVQGWTIGLSGRWLNVVLPPRPAAPPRIDIDLPHDIGKGMMAYTVQPDSLAMRRSMARLPLPDEVSVVSIIRDGTIRGASEVEHLAPGDDVLLLTPSEHVALLDRVFGTKGGARDTAVDLLGEFTFAADTPVGAVTEIYDAVVPANQRDVPLGQFMETHLLTRPSAGKRLRLGAIELIVAETRKDRVTRVAIELEPMEGSIRRFDPWLIWMRSVLWLPLERRLLAILPKIPKPVWWGR